MLESMVEYVVGYMLTLVNARGFIEMPMDTKINAALTILVFCLGEARKTPRHVRANVARVVFGYSVEFIGNESESDFIGSIKAAKRFKNGAAEAGMA